MECKCKTTEAFHLLSLTKLLGSSFIFDRCWDKITLTSLLCHLTIFLSSTGYVLRFLGEHQAVFFYPFISSCIKYTLKKTIQYVFTYQWSLLCRFCSRVFERQILHGLAQDHADFLHCLPWSDCYVSDSVVEIFSLQHQQHSVCSP